jgi:flagellar hook assembly protein FlgD
VIRYRLERAGPVSLKVYDLAGRLVSTLADSTVAEGWHQAQWFGRDDRGRRVSSGLYLYELVTPEGSQRRRMVLAR